MTKKYFIGALFVVLNMWLPFHNVQAQEVRLGGGVNYNWHNFKLGTDVQYRNLSPSEKQHVFLGQSELEYGVYKWLDVGLSYRYAAMRDYKRLLENRIDYEARNRFTFDVQLKSKRFENDVKIKNRLRYQVSVKENGKTKNYVRNKSTIDYKLTSLLRPFAEVEVYYNIREQALQSARFYLGSSWVIDDHTIDIAAIVEADWSNYFQLNYVLELTYKFDL